MKTTKVHRIKNWFFVGALLFMLIGCGKIKPKGEVITQRFPISAISSLEASGRFRVFYVHSSIDSVEVESYPNYIKNLSIDNDNHQLKIKEKREPQGDVMYNVTVYSHSYPQSIKISDAVEFNVSGELKGVDIHFKLKDNAKLIGSIRSKKANLEMEDSSLANFKGYSQEVNLKIKDSAAIIAPYWMVDVLDIASYDASYAEFNVKDSIKGAVKNKAKFIYYGAPVNAFSIDKETTVKNTLLK